MDMTGTKRTVDLDTASTLLNIKKAALRKRIQRGSIEAVKDRAGKWQVVIDDDGVMNEEGLRSPLEFVQHKLLDLIGDLSLLGHPIWGDIITHKPGHQLQAAFMTKLMEHFEQIFEVVPAHQLISVQDEDPDLMGSAIATFG